MSPKFVCTLWAPTLCVQYELQLCVYNMSPNFVYTIWAPTLCVQYEPQLCVYTMSPNFVYTIWAPTLCIQYEPQLYYIQYEPQLYYIQYEPQLYYITPWMFRSVENNYSRGPSARNSISLAGYYACDSNITHLSNSRRSSFFRLVSLHP